MCKARRYNDEMQCGQCGLTWDIKDNNPPICELDIMHKTRLKMKTQLKLSL